MEELDDMIESSINQTDNVSTSESSVKTSLVIDADGLHPFLESNVLKVPVINVKRMTTGDR